MPTPARDRFDDVPQDLARVGAHRAPPPRGRAWIGFLWAALATAALIVAGLVVLSILNPDLEIRPPTGASEVPVEPEPDVVVEPSLDPEVPITVLNGTPTAGLATTVGDFLVEQGWGGAELGVGSRAMAAANDVAVTQVFYSDPGNEAAARMLVQHLGAGEIRLSDEFPESPITVLIGADYVRPQ